MKLLQKILLFILKEVFSFCIKFCLALFCFIIIGISIFSYYIKKDSIFHIEEGSYVNIYASNMLTEHIPVPDPFSIRKKPLTFFELLYALDAVRGDHRIAGVLLHTDYSIWSKAQMEEIGEKLKLMQEEGKNVIAVAQSMNRHDYFLSSYAGEILMPPIHAAGSEITAYHYEEMYWKQLLDRFGVKVNVIHIGDYKSYMENYARGTMSKEFRENMTEFLEKAYQYSLDVIAKNRKYDRENLAKTIEEGKLMGTSYHALQEHGLVDKGQYPNSLYQQIGSDKLLSMEDYYQAIKETEPPKQYIALLSLEGDIEDESLFLDEVNYIKEDERVAGVILRIDSPGGSALAADLMYQAVKELSKKVPVYSSIGGVAASGGYYVASAGEKIFASPLSLTGSIGVVSMIPDFSGLQEKASVKQEEIQKGKYADLYSSMKPLSEENFQRMQESNRGVYQDFLSVVSQNRKIDKEYLDQELAGGRIWLGVDAKEHKLIDNLGGLEDAIVALGEDKNISHLPILEISQQDIWDGYLSRYQKFTKWIPFQVKEKKVKRNLWNQSLMYFPYQVNP